MVAAPDLITAPSVVPPVVPMDRFGFRITPDLYYLDDLLFNSLPE